MFDDFETMWQEETFLIGAFGLDQDITAYLDDPLTGEGDYPFDKYSCEINRYAFSY